MGVCSAKVTEPREEDDELAGIIVPDTAIGEQLKRVQLLGALTSAERAKMGGALKEKKFNSGDIIGTEGKAEQFYLILSGACVLTESDGQEIATLSQGEWFGENSLTQSSTFNCSVVARGTTICRTMTTKEFRSLFGKKKLGGRNHRAAVSAESNESDTKSSAPANAVRDKSAQDMKIIRSVVDTNELFTKFVSRTLVDRVVDLMWKVEVNTGQNIITQGEMGHHFYIVSSGHFDIFVQQKAKSQEKVAECGPGKSFGELSLLYSQPRAATVTATEPSIVWAVDRFGFNLVRQEFAEQKLKEYDDILTGAFPTMSRTERVKLAGALETQALPDNHTLFNQGDEGNTFYIVQAGEVKVEIDGKEILRYGPGKSFGERALILTEPRAASIITTQPTTLLYVDQKDFTLVFGEAVQKQFLDRVAGYSSDSTPSSPRSTSFAPASSYAIVEDSDQKFPDFVGDLDYFTQHVLGTLGRGSFGHVQLVSDENGTTYALKAVNKSHIVSMGQQDHIISEKQVMAELKHPFLIRLFATFKDSSKLYFLMEPALGGELFTVLRRMRQFDVKTAQFYAASVVLAFEYMHSKGIIYRDLKPENLLLTRNGYIKITDFGFAKKIGTGAQARTWTLCGTPDYLAPEVIGMEGHGKAVDWWTLGILIFEMLAGWPPFFDELPVKIYKKINSGLINFPYTIKPVSTQLVKSLLAQKVSKRLGNTRTGVDGIKTHNWFKHFAWDDFLAQRMPAPIEVSVRDHFDLSNFESEDYLDDEDEEEFGHYEDDSGWDDLF
jgi:cGMP-dependent protein kinase